MSMLVDNISLTVIGGNGGDGVASFLRDGQTTRGGPNGGNGGNGGNIYLQGSVNTSDLREFRYKKKIVAESGVKGKNGKKHGKNAPDLTIYVPVGTQVTDTQSGYVFEIMDTDRPVLVALGGKGGRGNDEFKSATNQSPDYYEKGVRGEEKKLFLELKIIAEIGLIGLPNAGKSSILAVLTHATPKIGNFPFTTLEPNIGMMGAHSIADIPGLIEGASMGKGLGITFLRHIEKTKVLVHCIESYDKDCLKTYEIVRSEFEKYSKTLLEKNEIILLTKTDNVTPEILRKNKKIFEKMGKQVLTSSIYDEKSIDTLKETLLTIIKK